MAKKQEIPKSVKQTTAPQIVAHKRKQAYVSRGYADPYVPTDYSKTTKKNLTPKFKMESDHEASIPVKKWLGMLFIQLIPLVNLIALIAWSSKKNTRVSNSQRNYARATLIFSVIVYAVVAILGAVMYFVFPELLTGLGI